MKRIIQNIVFSAVINDAQKKGSQSKDSNSWDSFIDFFDIIYGNKILDIQSLKAYFEYICSNNDCLYNISYFLNEIENFTKLQHEQQKQIEQFIQLTYFLYNNLSSFIGLNIIINEFLKIEINHNHLLRSKIELLTSDLKILKKHSQKILLQIEYINESNTGIIFYTKEYTDIKNINIEEISTCKQLYEKR